MAKHPHDSGRGVSVKQNCVLLMSDYISNVFINAPCFCLSTHRMRSTGPGGIKTTRQQSVPGMLAVSRRTKYLCVLPTWRERTPPSDRKWLKSGRNWAAVATSLVNTRTILLTSDEGMGGIRKGRKKSWI